MEATDAQNQRRRSINPAIKTPLFPHLGLARRPQQSTKLSGFVAIVYWYFYVRVYSLIWIWVVLVVPALTFCLSALFTSFRRTRLFIRLRPPFLPKLSPLATTLKSILPQPLLRFFLFFLHPPSTRTIHHNLYTTPPAGLIASYLLESPVATLIPSTSQPRQLLQIRKACNISDASQASD